MPRGIADFWYILLIASEGNDGKGIAMNDTENKNRGIYLVKSYDGTISKVYKNFKSAYKYANKLARNGILCALLEVTENGPVEIAAC